MSRGITYTDIRLDHIPALIVDSDQRALRKRYSNPSSYLANHVYRIERTEQVWKHTLP